MPLTVMSLMPFLSVTGDLTILMVAVLTEACGALVIICWRPLLRKFVLACWSAVTVPGGVAAEYDVVTMAAPPPPIIIPQVFGVDADVPPLELEEPSFNFDFCFCVLHWSGMRFSISESCYCGYCWCTTAYDIFIFGSDFN